jgi:tetratricopeptide (TPR) repeat protein
VSLISDLNALGFESAATVRTTFGQKTVAYLDKLAAEAKGDPNLQADLAAAYLRLGSFQGHPATANVGDRRSAAASYQKSIGLLEPLVAAHPANEDYVGNLAVAYLAKALALGPTDVVASLGAHQRAMDVAERVIAAHPNEAEYQLQRSTYLELVGERFGHPTTTTWATRRRPIC